ncbi:SAM-dependent methyltransferase [Aquisalimonas asiatica]|uniref:Cyclopropane-fatty-acyl-phospholipid synthase n=1 Tax=Aquisalimonas asiatica TaxID=406100 RepID=A0A1H8TMF0_9GAMM|nr:cyclopropane-fatty-acyl-phospholipid synthase family protein [Aquisalimonas asiatica]SEO92027.1 cyclopropane-fatty-acyl-phospholipid synthase [Aquisalimonas asiatica]
MAWDKSMTETARNLPGISGRYFSAVLNGLARGTLEVEFPDGSCQTFGNADGIHADLHVHRPWRTLIRLRIHGALGLAEGYLAGDWTTSDLTALLQLLGENDDVFGGASRPSALALLAMRLRHRLRANTHRGSRRNIAAHYDLGNDFYREWLDPTMTYSAALFGESGTPQTDSYTLEQAQQRKYQRILEQLDAPAGSHLLEIGCGWGGFGRAAAAAGHRVTGLSLSRQQLEWAEEQSRAAGLQDALAYHYRDYRDETGQYDHAVSIEMFEAVGERYWPEYFETLARCLKPGGRAALQVITIDEAAYPLYRETPDFIQLYIFPGGMLPTRGHLQRMASAAGLRLRAMTPFGLHYAETLRLWQERFNAHAGPIGALGYDTHFMRMWRYYLSYCEAGFRMGNIDLVQFVLERPEYGT